MNQRSLTLMLYGLWLMSFIVGAAYFMPFVKHELHVKQGIASAISFVGWGIATTVLHIMPLMLGMGVIWYKNQWDKAVKYATTMQYKNYESYIIVTIKPFLLQLLIFVPVMVLLTVIMRKLHLDADTIDTVSVIFCYCITFFVGIGFRLIAEYTITIDNKKQNHI